MSIEAIERGVQSEKRVTTIYTVRCDDRPSGFVEVSKTPPSGANAMTVTIKPLYGEAFTVNADLLRRAVDMALHEIPRKFEEHYRDEAWRRKCIERIVPGQRIEIEDRGAADRRRLGTVTTVDDYYVHLTLDREHEEERPEWLRRKVPKMEIAKVYDLDAPALAEDQA